MKHIITKRIGRMALILATLLLSLAGTTLADSADGPTAIYPYVIGGGGGHSEAYPYVLDGTVGQAVAGTVTNPSYDLCAGFWCGMGHYKVYLPLVLRSY